MYAVIGLLKKPDGVSTEEFRSWWRERHVPHVLAIPGILHYTIYPIEEIRVSMDPEEYSTDSPYDGVAIIAFESREAKMKAFASEAGVEDRRHLNNWIGSTMVFGAQMEVKHLGEPDMLIAAATTS